ncbi:MULTISPECIES: sensor histidine kinase [unclassified Nocardioides]|uniref:sensor histidine kinase n=1 Tax=unclassified Nocardioides TaxID=2615069 RepID=UPI0009F0E68D|nr:MULTISPECIES: HAMP domain-containing sensor histidine kinase [unclassified Nocardioides]GAW51620.1 ATPase domain-containing protein [Nocardioides sp. PD653-B2]GAW56821.1 ATPase domain-containing protein [Nocardioides sp. PD653]
MRITASVALLVFVGLAVAGVVVSTIESHRLDQQVADQADQEFSELRRLQGGRQFAGPEAMVRAFMASNVPDDDELLIGWWDDDVRAQFPEWNAISRSTWLPDAIRPLLASNGTTRLDSEFGELEIAVQAVQQGDTTGALVVVTFLDRAREGLHETMRTYAIVAGLVLLLVTAMAAWVSGRLLSPVRTLRETADEIGETDLSQRLPVTGNDDLTALTRTFNGMLDRLEGAFVGQRQFLDDAGHELKTPLTVLRGHLELLDTGNPEEIAETRELLLDETDRMSRLVGDLLLLAKSDRPDFLRLRPVDLQQLTADLVAKARGLGDREWTLDGSADAKVLADEQRLTQAVLQLVDNAVKHTRDGDAVAIGSAYDGSALRMWVRDTGPGVPPEDRAHVFERFGRAAVPPGDEGFGLGLSIVGAIARAHGGTVTVEDADPPGARFVITLPSRPQEDPWPAS